MFFKKGVKTFKGNLNNQSFPNINHISPFLFEFGFFRKKKLKGKNKKRANSKPKTNKNKKAKSF